MAETKPKKTVQEALSKSWEELLDLLNKRFDQGKEETNLMLQGLSSITQRTLNKLEANIGRLYTGQKVTDLTTASLMELLDEKGILKKEEVVARVQAKFAEHQAEEVKKSST